MDKPQHVSLAKLTDPWAVRSAIREFDDIGRSAFLKKYGYGEAKEYFLEQDGRRYDSKAIVGAAYGFQHGTPLTPNQFSGGEETVMRQLKTLGFTVVKAGDGGVKDWTDQELQAAVEAYLGMLKLEREEKPYSKADVNKSLRDGPLRGRTKAAIEYRMQNVSAVMEEFGQPRVKGYIPALNVGENVKARIRKALEANGLTQLPDFTPTADDRELERRVLKLRQVKLTGPPTGQDRPATVETTSQAYVRDPLVKAWVLQNAQGVCEGCGNPAPFLGDDGQPFLESHHVRPLGDGGSDRITNAAALCPNCHRRCHQGIDRYEFTKGLYAKIQRLVSE